MASPDDQAGSVDKSAVREPIDTPVLFACALAYLEVLDCIPASLLNVSFYGLVSIVTGNTNDDNFIIPFIFVVHKHLLVVGHGCLAGWAPSGPEVN